MVTYFLRVGEGEGDISETNGICQTRPRTFCGLTKVRTSARQRVLQNMITYRLRVDEGEEDIREKGRLQNTITYVLRVGDGEENISKTKGTSKT
jgi:hypothetical protein